MVGRRGTDSAPTRLHVLEAASAAEALQLAREAAPIHS